MNLPGSAIHQDLLRRLVELFQDDQNVRMFGVFGSLVRGDWDQYSDLDLDVIMTDVDKRRVAEQVERVSAALNRAPYSLLVVFEERPGSWVFITDGLERLSIRFHTLIETGPNILDTLLILTGTLTVEDLAGVARSNRPANTSLHLQHSKLLEQAIYVPIYLHRNQLLAALRVMQTLRDLIVNIYSEVHDIPKAEKFEARAYSQLVEALLDSYSAANYAEIHRVWRNLVQLYRSQISIWTESRIELGPNEQELIDRVLHF